MLTTSDCFKLEKNQLVVNLAVQYKYVYQVTRNVGNIFNRLRYLSRLRIDILMWLLIQIP